MTSSQFGQFLMDESELAKRIGRAPCTVRRWHRLATKTPANGTIAENKLPTDDIRFLPFAVVCGRRLYFRAAVEAWEGGHLATPDSVIEVNIAGSRTTLNAEGLADLLHISPRTVQTYSAPSYGMSPKHTGSADDIPARMRPGIWHLQSVMRFLIDRTEGIDSKRIRLVHKMPERAVELKDLALASSSGRGR
jgi:hypothetical protein